jgi:hypothetical protein
MSATSAALRRLRAVAQHRWEARAPRNGALQRPGLGLRGSTFIQLATTAGAVAF